MSNKCKSGKLRQKQRKQAFIAAGKTHTSGLIDPRFKQNSGPISKPSKKMRRVNNHSTAGVR